VALLLCLLVNLNQTSMHDFYRDRLRGMWLHKQDPKLTEMPERPYVLINASANLQRPELHRIWSAKAPTKEPLAIFTFSRASCGSDRLGFVSTKTFERGELTIADALAISGAALNPAVMNNPLLMTLLFLFNSRTGYWVINPHKLNAKPNLWRWFPSPLVQFLAYLFRNPRSRKRVFLSDGGHHENLGVESLLRRHCRIIIASDASQDPDFTFLDFTRVMRRIRAYHGIRLKEPHEGAPSQGGTKPVWLERLTPDPQSKLAEDHLVIAEIDYKNSVAFEQCQEVNPEGKGYLIYIKPNFTGDEPPDLLHYRMDNKDFPFDPTLDQFYDPRRFECYRHLGYHIGTYVVSILKQSADSTKPDMWLRDWMPDATTHNPVEADAAFARLSGSGFALAAAADIKSVEIILASGSTKQREDATTELAKTGPAAKSDLRKSLVTVLVRALARWERDGAVRALIVKALGAVYADKKVNREVLETLLADPREEFRVHEAAEEALADLDVLWKNKSHLSRVRVSSP
jgi:hypothetical protein